MKKENEISVEIIMATIIDFVNEEVSKKDKLEILTEIIKLLLKKKKVIGRTNV